MLTIKHSWAYFNRQIKRGGRIEGHSVFITGAAKGIGYELAVAFAQQGSRVMISDLKEEDLKQAVAKSDVPIEYVVCDVTDEQAIEQAILETHRRFGRVDVLINNAGLQHVDWLEEFPTETYESMIKIMLVAPFIAMKHAIPIMKKQNYGRIINVASINGVIGFEGKAAYNSAKHGVIGLTKVAALETAPHGITVNAICPGYVNTSLVENQYEEIAQLKNITKEEAKEALFQLIPQNRLLEIEEITQYVLYIASEGAKGLTGQALIIDGGYTAK